MAVAQRGKLWKLPRVWKSGKTNCMFSHFPTSAWKTRRKKAATSFPQFPQLLLLVLLPKKGQKECDISNELKHVTFLKSFDKQPFDGLTTNWRAGIVPRLEHGAFLVLTCGGALLVETGRGINVIVA
jgi:hypothetical protein